MRVHEIIFLYYYNMSVDIDEIMMVKMRAFLSLVTNLN